MNLKAIIPTPAEFGREALILLGGALIAATGTLELHARNANGFAAP